ncbi:MAG: ankyrin repeat domain-containing protein [Spirochaetes bacterium]|nr:ankyrin repeat domain-containing protein [Spirochaetota bacterium]
MKHLAIVVLIALSAATLISGCSGAYNGALADAARVGDVKDAETYLDKGAGINNLWFGRTPLQVAAEEGKLEMVKFLIEKGANVNKLSKFDKTALDYALEKKHAVVAGYIQGRGGRKGSELKK